jgi:hypothetical protein
MVKAWEAARKAARQAQEAMYEGRCTIAEHRTVRSEKTKLSEDEEVIVWENEPCRLSFETVKAAGSAGPAAAITQTVKLFLSPEIKVKPGSRITVRQNQVSTDYKSSGAAAVYPTHQEILLELFERWA